MNDLLLKIFMLQHGDTKETLAKALGIAPHTLYMKMRQNQTKGRKQEFIQSEIEIIAKRYNLTPDKISEIFFNTNENGNSELNRMVDEIARRIENRKDQRDSKGIEKNIAIQS